MESTLNAIRDALESVDGRVYYGTAADHPKDAPWDYTVFSRESTAAKANLTGYTETFIVSVVRESHVPDGTLDELVAAMASVPGMKLDASRAAEYVYDVKPGTRQTVEMLVARFARGRK